jgi:hypothetical protein
MRPLEELGSKPVPALFKLEARELATLSLGQSRRIFEDCLREFPPGGAFNLSLSPLPDSVESRLDTA